MFTQAGEAVQPAQLIGPDMFNQLKHCVVSCFIIIFNLFKETTAANINAETELVAIYLFPTVTAVWKC